MKEINKYYLGLLVGGMLLYLMGSASSLKSIFEESNVFAKIEIGLGTLLIWAAVIGFIISNFNGFVRELKKEVGHWIKQKDA